MTSEFNSPHGMMQAEYEIRDRFSILNTPREEFNGAKRV